jgi:hypothetical protein
MFSQHKNKWFLNKCGFEGNGCLFIFIYAIALKPGSGRAA